MTKEVFFDTDCLSAFLWINDTNVLEELYGGNIVLPNPVYNELSNPRVPQLKKRADTLIAKKMAVIKEIEVGSEEYKIYRKLVKGDIGGKAIGKGEAAGIALAKAFNGILASNNYRDIAYFVKKFDLCHIDTGMILKEALDKKMITEFKGNEIWKKMLDRNRQLPAESFSRYLKDGMYKTKL